MSQLSTVPRSANVPGIAVRCGQARRAPFPAPLPQRAVMPNPSPRPPPSTSVCHDRSHHPHRERFGHSEVPAVTPQHPEPPWPAGSSPSHCLVYARNEGIVQATPGQVWLALEIRSGFGQPLVDQGLTKRVLPTTAASGARYQHAAGPAHPLANARRTQGRFARVLPSTVEHSRLLTRVWPLDAKPGRGQRPRSRPSLWRTEHVLGKQRGESRPP